MYFQLTKIVGKVFFMYISLKKKNDALRNTWITFVENIKIFNDKTYNKIKFEKKKDNFIKASVS